MMVEIDDPSVQAQAFLRPFSPLEGLLAASGLRDRALTLLCAHGGLRIMEALALTWADLQGDALVVRHGRGGKGRQVTCFSTLSRCCIPQLLRCCIQHAESRTFWGMGETSL